MSQVDFPRSQPRNDRVTRKVKNNLGVIRGNQDSKKEGFYRRNDHHQYDKYYENMQYEGLKDWEMATKSDEYVPIRDRKPRIAFPFASVLAKRVVGKLIGQDTFPRFLAGDDPQTEDYLKWILKTSRLRSKLIDPLRRMTATGSVFVRFAIVNGAFSIEHTLSKYCYPTLAPNGDLAHMTVAYVFEDKNDVDVKGQPKRKWFRQDFGPDADTLFDTPEYEPGVSWQETHFEEVEVMPHGLGFVQGEWFTTAPTTKGVDGPSMIGGLEPFIDELSYSLSQSSQIIQYNQDPQLVVTGLSEDELTELIRSTEKAWNLGREGTANFLEAQMSGAQVAQEFRDKLRLGIQDIARIVLMDPEKMAMHAQSGRALELLHGPMVELINELRPAIEPQLTSIVQKMAIANWMFAQQGGTPVVTMPQGFVPGVDSVIASWPPIFQKTLDDIQKKVSIASQASMGKLISRMTLTRWLAADFDIDDVEQEIKLIDSEPDVFQPFGL